MGWETVTYQCGHVEQQQFYGPHSDRQRRVAALASMQCPACRAAAARAADQAAGLPTLLGSEKQVAWASEIRAKIIAEIPAASDKLSAALAAAPAERREAFEAQFRAAMVAIEQIKTTAQAGWWIEQRGQSAQAIITRIVRGS